MLKSVKGLCAKGLGYAVPYDGLKDAVEKAYQSQRERL